jgi:hypothetical protein
MYAPYTILKYSHPPCTETGARYLYYPYFAIVNAQGICPLMATRHYIFHTNEHPIYSTLEEWEASLHGRTLHEPVTIITSIADMVRNFVPPAQSNKWNKPSISPRTQGLKWHRYIYQMIKECDSSLLAREDMRDAFNYLVAVTSYYNEYICSTEPRKKHKYDESNLVFQSSIMTHHHEFRRLIQVNTNPAIHTHELVAIKDIIYQAYLPLYELLKENVIPYMARKFNEACYQTDKKIYTQKRDYYVKKLIELTTKYERDANRIRTEMSRYQDYLDDIEAKRNASV